MADPRSRPQDEGYEDPEADVMAKIGRFFGRK